MKVEPRLVLDVATQGNQPLLAANQLAAWSISRCLVWVDQLMQAVVHALCV
jgi:hypothetical protein